MTIKEWLENPSRSYADGILLYNNIKLNTGFDHFFSSVNDPKPGSIHFLQLIDKLNRALRKLNENSSFAMGSLPKPSKPIVVTKIDISKRNIQPSQQHITQKTHIVDLPGLKRLEDLSSEAQVAYIENKSLITQLAEARQRLAQCKTSVERQPIASEISSLNNKQQKNWRIINQQLPPQSCSVNTDFAEISLDPSSEALKLNRRLTTLKLNISRAKKEIKSKNFSFDKIESRKLKIQKWTHELNLLSLKLPK